MKNNIFLTVEEKAIIVDFIACAVGEGYSGDNDLYNNEGIDEKLVIISKKLGFSRKDIGIEHATCKVDFEKNGVKVQEDENLYYKENSRTVDILTKDKEYLELTFEEANKYFK